MTLEEQVKECELEIKDLTIIRQQIEKENKELKQEVQMLEKLIELNLKDLWDIVDQRDWYYSEYQRLKTTTKSNYNE
jgi:septal ring factor EnvC (AmiA/AmiB activator)